MMDKYKELVAAMRRCASESENCDGCPRYKESYCYNNVMLEAADAIEDLIACLDTAHEYVDYCKHGRQT